MQAVGVRGMAGQHLHRIFDALTGASNEIRIVLLAHAGGLGLLEYSEAPEPLEDRPEIHGRARRIADSRFGFDEGDSNSGLRQTERVDEADWPTTDDYYLFHRAVSWLARISRVAHPGRAPNNIGNSGPKIARRYPFVQDPRTGTARPLSLTSGGASPPRVLQRAC